MCGPRREMRLAHLKLGPPNCTNRRSSPDAKSAQKMSSIENTEILMEFIFNIIPTENDLLNAAKNAAYTTAILAFIFGIFRKTVFDFVKRSIDYRFDVKIESLKSDIKNQQNTLEYVRSFISSGRRERDAALQAKRMEAAESLIRCRDQISKLKMAVEYARILDIDYILKNSDNTKTQNFIEELIDPLEIEHNIDNIKNIDFTYPRLYLSQNSIENFDAYLLIALRAVTLLRLMSTDAPEKYKLTKQGFISNKIMKLYPNSADQFKEHGENYSFFLFEHFYDEILNSLRKELSGGHDVTNLKESAYEIAMQSHNANLAIAKAIKQQNISENVMKK